MPASVFGLVLNTPIAIWLLSASLLHGPRAFLNTPIALSAFLMGGDLNSMSRDGCGVSASVFGPVLSTPIALSLLSASLLHVPRAFLSTPIALCASLMGGDLSAMSRDVCGVTAGVREWLRANFEHPYRAFAPACLTLARAKSISEHPYRTVAPRSFTLARAKSISEHPYRTLGLSNGGRS